MTTAAAIASDRPETRLELYRDDGPLARALGSALGGIFRVPPVLLMAAGACPLLCVLAIEGDGASDAAVGAVIALARRSRGASPAAGRTPTVCAGRCRRCCASSSTAPCSGSARSPAARRRPRPSRSSPCSPFATTTSSTASATRAARRRAGSATLAGGWDGRLVAGYVLLVAGALPAGVLRRSRACSRVRLRDRERRFVGARPAGPRASSSTRTRRTTRSDRHGARRGRGQAPRAADRRRCPRRCWRSTATARSSTSRSRTSRTSASRRRWSSRASRAERIDERLPALRAPPRAARSSSVFNPKALEWNNAYSLWCARDAVRPRRAARQRRHRAPGLGRGALCSAGARNGDDP